MISAFDIEVYLWLVALCIFVFLIDDLFIDFIAYIKKLRPRPISKNILYEKANTKKLAIMVANWKEEDVLEVMVKGNMANLPEENVHLFLGVYPNDHETLNIALKMERDYSRVHVVVNRLDGPTYKGQMLNEIVQAIFKKEESLGFEFEGFILHDSEDILDPAIPYLYSLGLRQADFIQTPVFSLPVNWWELTSGTYMDEFAEIHSKDLLVRQYLGAALPSAGVGTCLSRRLILTFLARQEGKVFLPNSLTEDYQLGLQSTEWGFHSSFLCFYIEGTDCSKIISTREFFPHYFWHSVRQKTRWTTGIVFQGLENLGWFGNFWQRYFLWRDRKGVLNAVLTANLLVTMAIFPFLKADFFPHNKYLFLLLMINTVGMVLRFSVRIHCVARIYGAKRAVTAILRWPVAMLINMWAGLRSTKQYVGSQFTGKEIKWVKTQHRMPEGFGQVIEVSPAKPEAIALPIEKNEFRV